MLKLFGNSNKSDDKTLKAVKGKLKELFGEGTDAELMDKFMQLESPDTEEEEEEEEEETEKADEKTDKSKKADEKTDKTDTAEEDENTEGEADKATEKTEVASLKKAVATLQKQNKALEEKYEMLNLKLAALGKLPARTATGGKKEVFDAPKKGEFTDKDAPKFD